jgi:uncharacterized phage protein (TIGR02218 family)
VRTIAAQLLSHYATGRTSVCMLVKVKCKDGTIIAFTTLDAAVTFTDGPDGPITYSPTNGVTPSEMVQVGDLSVDTAEATGWISDSGITEQQIRSGIFNFARWWIFEVNYLDLSDGYVLKGSGTTGETRFSDKAWTVELRAKKQQLKQPMVDMYKLPCRVKYGSAACGKTFEWAGTSVESVDADEPDRIFYAEPNSSLLDAPAYNYGVVRVTSGDNAGAEVEVELHSEDSNGIRIELLLPLPYPLAPADTLDIRIDCNKLARDADGGCLSPLRWGADWVRHHRGFPDIPTADGASLQVPGAQTPFQPGTGSQQ